MLRISVIIICYNRKRELRECIDSLLQQTRTPDEIIVVDNNSSDGTSGLFAESSRVGIRYVRLAENLGVAGGRNVGIRQATGDILCFIDDDALLGPETAIEMVCDKFDSTADIGILSFKVINYYSKTIQREEFPHVDKSLDPDQEFETSYFIGCGNAIRREVFDKCGLYVDEFFYGFEELDLSFRAMDNGYKIMYYPAVVVNHKKSLSGRMTDERQWIYSYRNRLAVSYKYLKNVHLAFLMCVWFPKILWNSSKLSVPIKGICEFNTYRKQLKRTPVSDETLRNISRLKGRIWY